MRWRREPGGESPAHACSARLLSEHRRNAEYAARDVAGKSSARVERNGKQHDNQQRFRRTASSWMALWTPFDAQVFYEVGPEGAGHLCSSVAADLDQSAVWAFYIESRAARR